MVSESSPFGNFEPGVKADLSSDQEMEVKEALRQQLNDPNSIAARKAAALRAREQDQEFAMEMMSGQETTQKEDQGILHRLTQIFRGGN